MSVKALFVNLPVHDLARTRAFWTALGFSIHEMFSDENALCVVLREELLYVMCIVPAFYATFTPRPLADGTTTQVLLALQVDSREQVDELVGKALAHGGSRYKEPADHGWMYYDTFADPDGHQWEVLFSDPSAIPPQ